MNSWMILLFWEVFSDLYGKTFSGSLQPSWRQGVLGSPWQADYCFANSVRNFCRLAARKDQVIYTGGAGDGRDILEDYS